MEMLFGIVYIMVIMDDIYYNILLNLDIVDIGICGSVDKTFNRISKLEILWENIYFINFSSYDMDGTYYETCKRYYCIGKLDSETYGNIDQLIVCENLRHHYHKINSIPTEIGLLKNLKVISFCFGHINEIPTEIGLLKNLISIVLTSNQITIIPTHIGLLTNLEMLLLGNNKIQSIPTEIGLLNKLCILHLHLNQIKTIPTEILLLKDIYKNSPIATISRKLLLYNNLIEEIPKEMEDKLDMV